MKYGKGEFLLTPNKSHLRGLEPVLQVLFLWLSEHSDDSNTSFPSRQTLAAECGISVRTMDRAMQKLIDLGLLKKKSRFNGNEQTTNLYHVIIKAPGSVKSARGSDKFALGSDKNDTQNSPHLTHPIEYIGVKTPMGDKSPGGYGDSSINELLSFWATTTGLPIHHRVRRNREACHSLLESQGREGVERLIKVTAKSQGQRGAPIVSDFIDLNTKLSALEVWNKRNAPTSSVDILRTLYPERYARANTPISSISRTLAQKMSVR